MPQPQPGRSQNQPPRNHALGAPLPYAPSPQGHVHPGPALAATSTWPPAPGVTRTAAWVSPPCRSPHRPPKGATHTRNLGGRGSAEHTPARLGWLLPPPATGPTLNPASPTLSVCFPLNIRWHGEAGGTEPRPGGRWGPTRGRWPATMAAPGWPPAEGRLLSRSCRERSHSGRSGE